MDVELRDNERRTLIGLKELGGRGSIDDVSRSQKLAHAAVMRAVLSLRQKGLVDIHERRFKLITLLDEGRLYADEGLPERRLLKTIRDLRGRTTFKVLSDKASMDGEALSVALGWLIKKGWAVWEENRVALKIKGVPPAGEDEKLLEILFREGPKEMEELDKKLKGAVPNLRRRRLIKTEMKTDRSLELTPDGWMLLKRGLEEAKELTRLDPKLISTGMWRSYRFRKYDVKAPVSPTWSGKRHPYLCFLDEVRRKLVAMGFKEMVGPTVETAFFNFDALFTPQDHPAREIFDVYIVKNPDYGDLSGHRRFLWNVKETHENGWRTGSKGWGYEFSLKEAARLILRGHGTALSARTLISEELEIPGKYFSIVRCYRPEVVDKTHLSEFNQVEGIIVGEGLNLRDLLGVLKRFAIEIAGADDVRFRPDYFPFTEPSVELSAYKRGYGWLEFGGSGIFRPEVTKPLGIEVPVIAWGLGVDRLFMMKARIDDIRFLFTQDLKWIRTQRLI